MSRIYLVSFEAISVAGATNDLFQIKGAAGKILRVRRFAWWNTDNTLATAQMLQTRGRFLPAAVSDGSGGSSSTPRPYDPGDSVASFTCLTNNTTKATSAGTPTIQMEKSNHIYAGLDYSFLAPPIVGPSESFVFELLSTPTGTVHLSGEADVEELGG